jgi:hypothetical protein
LGDDIKSSLKGFERSYGVQLFILAAYENPDETITISRYEMSIIHS